MVGGTIDPPSRLPKPPPYVLGVCYVLNRTIVTIAHSVLKLADVVSLVDRSHR